MLQLLKDHINIKNQIEKYNVRKNKLNKKIKKRKEKMKNKWS